MFELSGLNYEEVLEQGVSILVRVIESSSYRGFELSGLYCSSSSGILLKFKVLLSYNTKKCTWNGMSMNEWLVFTFQGDH